jgi:sugar O-acyltransferase (sialic acid O-acetyltransferase NeuD family)
VTRRLFIFGTGAHARKVAHYARDLGWQLAAFVDEAAGAVSPLPAVPVLAPGALPAPQPDEAIFVAIGRGEVRRRLMDDLSARGWPLPSLCHRGAWVAPDAELGEGVLVCAGAVVETRASVGRGTIVDIGVAVDHDCRVGRFCHLRPKTVLTSYAVVPDLASEPETTGP